MFHVPGRAWLLYAFDVGRAIDLGRCRTLITAREVAAARRREWPHLFGLDERPLVWHVEPAQVEVEGAALTVGARLILYDFGNVSVALSAGVAAGADLPPPLWSPAHAAALERFAVARLDELVARIPAAIIDRKPTIGPTRYAVLQVDGVPDGDSTAWLAAHGPAVAGLLRGEPGPLGADEVRLTQTRAVTYGPDDLVVVEAQAALIADDEWEDTLAVLDFANCERLTMQTLDDELDTAIAGAGELLRSRASRLRLLVRPWGSALRHLTQLTLDVTREYEAVENAIKLTGDDYLARIYRTAVERFHLRVFQDGISRKLQSLWNIQKVFLEQAWTRRSELLEWVIIVLIAVELVQALG